MNGRPLPVRHLTSLWRFHRADARLRLFCIPHAGGNAFVYRAWPEMLPQTVELVAVELAGRGTRLREPLATDLSAAAASLLPEILSLADRPYALFGHSMGALIAFELALQARAQASFPVCVFLAGCAPPPRNAAPLHLLPEPDFIAALANLNELPSEVIADPEMRRMVISILRADMTMVENYNPVPAARLPCAMTVLGGTADDMASAADLRRWAAHADGPFTIASFDGGHFFVKTSKAEVIACVAATLRAFTDPT